MIQAKENFIKFLIDNKALLFGEFTLKSGRSSPYFFNLGCLNDGVSLSLLGRYYADFIFQTYQDNYDVIFGPAYKGIPLSVAIAISLHRDFNLSKLYCSNRKEIKNYADKSILLGSEIRDGQRIILVDDVISTGTTKYEAVALLRSIAAVEIHGLVIALDREEVADNGQLATDAFTKETGIDVKSLINAHDIVEYLTGQDLRELGVDEDIVKRINRYLEIYGII